MSLAADLGLAVGDVLGPLTIGDIAHGGHCVARHHGRVIFVRHAIPGEVVRARLTQVAARFARADATEILEPSPHRVSPRCSIAGRCGGCDFQHIDTAYQRELKRRVVAELLGHLATYEFTGQVEPAEPADFGWRTRMRYHITGDGRPGLRAHRSSEVIALPEAGCAVARKEIDGHRDPTLGPPRDWAMLTPSTASAKGEIIAAVSASGAVCAARGALPPTLLEHAAGRDFRVVPDGFWQSHTRAPEILVSALLEALQPNAGETAFDLFCGVGLFAAALADAGCRVWGIEGDRSAVGLARVNVPEARFRAGDVGRNLHRLPRQADLVVLDPPRTGAGRGVMAAISAMRARSIAYVACDPAALGRDLRVAQDAGLRVVSVRAFDLFPMTHHVECLATLEPR